MINIYNFETVQDICMILETVKARIFQNNSGRKQSRIVAGAKGVILQIRTIKQWTDHNQFKEASSLGPNSFVPNFINCNL